MKIDAHQHFWDLSKPEFDYSWTDTDTNRPLNKSYLPETLKPHLEKCGVDKCVFVQTQHNLKENDWAIGLAEENNWIAGIVGWVDLASEDCEAQLCRFKDHPKFVGIRHVTQDEPNDDFIIQSEVVRGLKALEKHGVPFDLLFYVKHLRHAKTLAKMLPNLPMVINHLAKPNIKARQLDAWKKDLKAASKFPNIYCKLSGLITEADWQNWKPENLKPYVEVALESFGPARCMYGSDWPVCKLAGSYTQVHDTLAELIEGLTDNEQASIWSGTAIKFYGLELA